VKREIFLPIYIGFLARDASHFWLAQEDTIEGHIKNMTKGAKDHESVIKDIIERQDGKNK